MKWSSLSAEDAAQQGRELVGELLNTAPHDLSRRERLRTATRLLRRAVAGLESPSSQHAAATFRLALCEFWSYQARNQAESLNRAITLARKSMAESEVLGEKSVIGANLGVFLFERYLISPKETDFTEAAELLRQAVVHDEGAARLGIVRNLRHLLRRRLDRQIDWPVLRMALATVRYVDLLLAGSSEGSSADDWLDRQGIFEQLYQFRPSVQNARQCAVTFDLCARHQDRQIAAFAVSCLGSRQTLQAFTRHGAIDLLDRSADLASLALSLAVTDEQRGNARSSRAWVEIRRHEIEGIACKGRIDCPYRVAASELTTIAELAPDNPSDAINACSALTYAFAHGGQLSDLNRSITFGESAIRIIGQDRNQNSYNRPSFLTNLGNALRDRYNVTGSMADLRRGIDLHREAATSCPDGQWDKANHFIDLALGLVTLYESEPVTERAEEIASAYRRAIHYSNKSSLATAINAASGWSTWAEAAQRWDDVLESCKAGLDAIDILLSAQPTRKNKETWIRHAQDLSGRIAYAYVQGPEPQPGHALNALEDGRVRLLTDHFSSSLSLTGVDAARKVASKVPIVYVATTWAGSVAVVLRAGSVTPTTVALDDCGMRAVDRKVTEYVEATWEFARTQNAGPFNAHLDVSTSWTYRFVMEPILRHLGYPSKLCLVATGPLGLVPLHAGWTPDPKALGGRKYVDETTAVSYAPSSRALVQAQAQANAASRDDVLLVSDPQTEGAQPLPWSRREAVHVLSTIRGRGGTAEHLEGPNASMRNVEGQLRRAEILHFAGHGLAQPLSPMQSRLLLAGPDSLPVSRLLEAPGQLGHVRLAVLSACATAQTGTRLLNETVGLPSALMAAGAAGVIGSFWPIHDRATVMLVAKFYELWYRRNESPACALADAMRWLRTSTNSEGRAAFPEEWPDRPDGVLEKDWLIDRHFAEQPVFWASFALIGA